jgi:hypothetical protein
LRSAVCLNHPRVTCDEQNALPKRIQPIERRIPLAGGASESLVYA